MEIAVVRFGKFPSYTNERLFQSTLGDHGLNVEYDIRDLTLFMDSHAYESHRQVVSETLSEYGGQVVESP